MLSRIYNSISSTQMTVTPEMATEWLERNTHNRPITQTKVQEYAADMKKGQWDLNGEPIIFDWHGVLQDGQHRLWACVDAGVSFETMVTTGVDPTTFKTMDTGRARQPSDVLGIEKYPNRTTLAAAAAIAIRHERGDPRSLSKISSREILAYVQANPTLCDWVNKMRAKREVSGFASLIAGIMFLGARTYPQRAQEFIEQFQTGANLQPGSPVLALRNRLFAEKNLPRTARAALVISAWNAFVADRKLSIMKLTEEYPKIKGM